MTARKPHFEPVDQKCDFVAEEKKLLEHWYKNGIVKKYLNKNNSSSKYFSFLDGPITANNPMGVHHAWGRTYKDLWQRYKNMKGFKQRFQNGFDCQGLWVEVEVEKELGFRSKKDIDKYGVAPFVQKCKDRVMKYSSIQTDQTKRLGNFMDWENSYYTMSDENNYMIWYFLKKCHEKGLIYKGKDVVPWCYRCETAISEHEILTEDYKEIEHISVYLRLPVEGSNNEYLLVWTTTPWTIPANIAVAVDAKKEYALVSFGGKKYWLLEKLISSVFKNGYEVVKKAKGSELVGKKYKSPFDDLPSNVKLMSHKLFHTVVATDSLIMPISEDEGTGLVHTSTGTGAEDHRLGKKLDLPVMAAINDSADYLDDFGDLTYQNAKKNPEIIFSVLKEKENGNYLFELRPYKHRYPACWRCKSELVWKLTDEWYISIDPVREDMKTVAKKIKWIPSFGLKRELDWLTNMHDWLISKKNRYWGLALPIWECECGNFEVIGGYEELKERAVEGWSDFEGHTPHKPYIDGVQIKCSVCGKKMRRVSDVGNPWLDAGIVPFSTISKDNKSEPLYTDNKDEFYKWFPADFITESFPGQFKNWFYSVLAMSTILENKEPYKTVLGFATLLAEDGKPMHKSWGNAIEFNEGADKIGVDVMRWMFLSANPADNLLFGYKMADETRRRFYLKLWNIYNFFVTYANVDLYAPEDSNLDNLSVLDKWILLRLDETISDVEKYLEKYNCPSATQSIEGFVDDFSNWYIRRSRGRVGMSAEDDKDKKNFYDTTYLVLLVTAKILAPFLPFMSELIYKNLTKGESVHLENWPDKVFEKGDVEILRKMRTVKLAAEAVHSERKAKNVNLRQLLSEAEIASPDNEPDGEYIGILLDEVNLQTVKWSKKGSQFKIKLNTNITPELKEYAETRTLIRKIQNERKTLGVGLTDQINVRSDWLPENPDLLKLIRRRTLVKKLEIGDRFEVSK
jgi:isoleucyl-tRNA synthetase